MHHPMPGSRHRQYLQFQCGDHHLQRPVSVSGLVPRKTGIWDSHVLCSISAFILIFTEVPFLLRICPTSPKFDEFIRKFTTNWMRAGMYAVMSVVQFLSLLKDATSLIAAAVVLLIAAIFYALAAVKSQEFVSSKTLGGQGLAQMIV